MFKFKQLSFAVAALAGIVSTAAKADDFDQFEVRARFVRLDSKEQSSTSAATTGLGIPADGVKVQSKNVPEFDISYFFTKHIAAELILTYPQKLNVRLVDSVVGGYSSIGKADALPPTLTAQYHFTDILPNVDPYVGAGLNFTWITNEHIVVPPVPSLNLTTDKVSVMPALQIGVDYKVTKNWVVNADLKYTWIAVDLKSNGTKISTLTLDPLLIGVGFGYKF